MIKRLFILLVILIQVQAFGVGTFDYDEATNTLEVTDGTEGAPATFNDMFTADQAGTDTVLLDAGSPASDLALNYAVRPTHDKALKVKCVVANKAAEADYIFITGTDWKGDAQTEAIDVTAGNGSYETTKYWASITTLDCSDNAAGGGNVWADGDLTITQDIWGVVWEIVADAEYKIDCNIDFGNGVTATYFTSKNEMVYFANSCSPILTANATFQAGTKNNDYGTDGSYISMQPGEDVTWNASGTVKLYDTKIALQGTNLGLYLSNVDIRNCIFAGSASSIFVLAGTIDVSYLYAKSITRLWVNSTPTSFSNVYSANNTYGIATAGGTVTVEDISISNATTDLFVLFTDLTVHNPTSVPTTIEIADADSSAIARYSCNIHIADEDGADLAGVTVTCTDVFDTEVFSVVTDANGDIAEQIINYKKWTGTSETLMEYSPHEFTFTKAGFEPYKIKNVTMDFTKDWEVKLDGARGAWEVTWK